MSLLIARWLTGLNIAFFNLPGRNDVRSGRVNLKLDIRQNFFEKKSGDQEFVWLLEQFGATVPW